MSESAPLRLMIVDDQAIVRLGFQALLESQPDLSVVAVAGDGREAIRLASGTSVDVVLMDVRMPVMGGIEARAKLQQPTNRPRVLIPTTFQLDH